MKPQRPNILIIDDEISICESLQSVLEDEGYIVQTALSGEEGVRLLVGEHINLVFLDILIPGGMNGIETLERMKQMSPDTEAQAHGIVRHRPQMSRNDICVMATSNHKGLKLHNGV